MSLNLIDTLEDEGVIGGALPIWRRALVAHFLSNRAQLRLGAKAMKFWTPILCALGYPRASVEKFTEFVVGCQEFCVDESYELLAAWARGEASWSETWPAYKDIMLGRKPLPDRLMKLAEELTRS